MFTYPKEEKLKSHTTISELFTTGKSVSKYPLRMVYIPLENKQEDNIPLSIGVSVSKKHFKKAVDRNYFKRLLRESYRLNKHLLLEIIDQPYAIMLFYQTKDRLSFAEVNEKMIKMFEKFKDQLQQKQ
ncbi:MULTISPECIES: ribonuclease P protein component [Myroides]|uniref:Ribonuclease P protein component n=1 Tax=Myroides albus TaxID=2562892 RepID=A0A6I3LNW7_9FLAO|nr:MULTISPECIES: ribonuclease P protein component [Myroides]MTG97872.1 ribonuclease P protein component [Myroides albus]MVX34246.1 ribonuclease P protein component [Myroides sp. LoEW2-1]UVD81059.1 ribonuclease P protein component [Myroides albus]